MERTSSTTQVEQAQPPTQNRKLTIQGVVTHEKLMNWIKERNPIIAQARKDQEHR